MSEPQNIKDSNVKKTNSDNMKPEKPNSYKMNFLVISLIIFRVLTNDS